MLVGEQPGDYEDVAGKPFVGPAGKIMDRALEEAGIDRSHVYVTNAVKLFKWEPRGKRRRLSRIDRGTGIFRSVVPRHAGARQILSSKLAPKSWRQFIRPLCFGSRTKNRANVNTTASLSIFALP